MTHMLLNQPKPAPLLAPLRLLSIRLPNTLLPEVSESNTESAWQKFDDAVLQLDFARQSERMAWTR